jgi:hypothetical protein
VPVSLPSASPDERLIARVRALSEGTVDPAAFEERVGSKALVNTSGSFPLEALRRMPLAPEPDHPDETLELASAQTVIYWSRPIEAKNPRVVGIQIDQTGTAAVFFAVVFPP